MSMCGHHIYIKFCMRIDLPQTVEDARFHALVGGSRDEYSKKNVAFKYADVEGALREAKR